MLVVLSETHSCSGQIKRLNRIQWSYPGTLQQKGLTDRADPCYPPVTIGAQTVAVENRDANPGL